MIVTKEFIRQLNIVIETAIEHGGDAGGAYYCIPDVMLKEVKKLVKLLNDNRLILVWNDKQYKKYPIIKFKDEVKENEIIKEEYCF